MAVTRPELQTAVSNWQQRASYYNSLGIPQSQWYQIAQSDIQNVMNTGAQPLSTSQVNAAMASQLAGRTIVGNPVHHHHGIFGDLEGLVTSIPGDVSHLVTGFLPGAAHFLAHFPSEVTGTAELIRHGDDPGWLTAHGYEDPRTGKSNWSQAMADLRNIAHSPILSLTPAVADVANLTTQSGREYLMSHPVTAALDVAPAGKWTELGMAGLGRAGLVEAGEAGSATEALQRGKPVVAASRALVGASTRLPGAAGGFATAMQDIGVSGVTGLQRAANELGVGQQAKDLIRDKSVIGRKYSRIIKQQMKRVNEAFNTLGQDSRARITAVITGIDTTIRLSTEEEAAMQIAAEMSNTLKSYGEQIFRQTKGKQGLISRRYGHKQLTFSAKDPISRSIRNMDRLQKLLQKSHQARRGMETVLRRAQDRYDKAENALANARQTVPPQPTGALERNLADATRALVKAKSDYATKYTRHKNLQRSYAENRNSYYEQLIVGGGSQEMRPLVTDRMRKQMVGRRQQLHQMEMRSLEPLNDPTSPLYNPTNFKNQVKLALENLNQHLAVFEHGGSMKQMKAAFADVAERMGNAQSRRFGIEEFNAIRDDVVKSVLKLIQNGLDPIWLRHVDPGQEERFDARFAHRAMVIPDHVYDIKQYRSTVLNFAPKTMDIALGLTSAARDLYSSYATQEFLVKHVVPHMKLIEDLHGQYLKIAQLEHNLQKRLPVWNLAGHASALMNDEYENLDPNTFGLADWSGYGRFSKDSQVMIPKWLATNLKALMPAADPERFHKLSPVAPYDRVLRVFRFSVLTGPRHIVHVALGGLVPLMMREPFAPLYLKRSLDILHQIQEGGALDYEKLSSHLYDFTDGVYNKATGHQMGKWMTSFWEHKFGPGGVQRGLARFEETISDMYRISAALAAEARGVEREAAVNRALKVAVDMDDMAPFERTVLKQIFPFYGFTKFLFRFLLTYPVDHPYRAAILSRFATQEQQDWNSLIPEKFMMTLFLGHPDQYGNIKTVDMRNLNPFRSFANDMTSVGFFQSLNPVVGAALEARGFNVLSAVGPLYPSLEYNAQSGSLQAAPPTGTDKFATILQQFIPEFGALDHFVQLTDQMRILKRTNPAAYQSQLYSQLNLPGIFSPPITVNLPYVEEKAEMDRYQAAAQAVSKYEEHKATTTPPTSFNVVPYQGQYVDPRAFEAYWQQLSQQTGGIDPRALMSTPIHKTSQDPLELLSQLGGQLPAPPPTTY